MLKRVFLSVPATLDIRDLIHLNLINHLLKSDLGLKKWSLCVASSCWYQTALCCGFHYLSEFTSEEGKGLLAKGHRFSFYCQRNKSGWPQKRPKVTTTHPIHRGAVWDHTWDRIAIVLRSCDRSWQACSNNVHRASCENAFCLKPVQYHTFEVSSLAPGHSSLFFLFADVTSELFVYWRTPGLSGMDTIYGPARVTASDLVKNEDSLCRVVVVVRGGSKSSGTKMSFLINLLCGSKSMLFS